jgi:biotin carboxyl carrier protein
LKFKISVDNQTHEIEVKQQDGRTDTSPTHLTIDGKPFVASIVERDESCGTVKVRVNEKEFKIGLDEKAIVGGKPLNVMINEVPFEVRIESIASAIASRSDGFVSPKVSGATRFEAVKATARTVSTIGKLITPPMPGKIIAVKVKEGDTVKLGDVVLILEAMKMANEIKSPYAGKVKEVRVTIGQSVAPQDTLIAIE